MTGKTHIAGGLFSAACLATLAPSIQGGEAMISGKLVIAGVAIPALVAGIVVSVLASLLPDIDEPESLIVHSPDKARKHVVMKAGRRSAAARGLTALPFVIAQWVLRVASGIIRVLAGGHRGATHWLLTALLLTAGIWYLGTIGGYTYLWLWFVAGYCSHLVLDMMTLSGLKVLRPLTPSSIHLLPVFMRVRTGGSVDAFLGVLLLLGAVLLLYKRWSVQ